MRTSIPGALRFLGITLLLVSLFEACSSNDSTPEGAAGPPSITITSISLGNGLIGAGGASGVLTCDATIAVALEIEDWDLKPPGLCTVTKCGQVRVSLLQGQDGSPLLQRVAASASVDLNIAPLLSTLQAGSYTIRAELINDADVVFPITDAGNSSAEQSFSLTPPADCLAGAAGAPGGAGAGEGGMGGAPAGLGDGGTSGSAAAGAGGA